MSRENDATPPEPEVVFDRKLYQHDAFGKSVFRDAGNAGKIVRWMFRNKPNLLDNVDLERLEVSEDSYLDEELKEKFVDVLYRIPLKNGEFLCIFILIELKTDSEKFTMFQILRYILRIWEAAFKQAREAKTLATFLFPQVIPVIVHHGDGHFTAPTQLGELQNALEGFEDHSLKLEAMLYDLMRLPDSEFPDDVELWSAFTVMRAVFRPNVDEQLLSVYEKVYPLFEERPKLLERWRSIFWYAISSCKYFTEEMCAKTINKIRTVRGKKMSTTETPVYLADIWEARGEAKGKAEGKAEDVLRVLIRQQGTIPESLAERVRAITDIEKLDELFDLAFDSKTLDEFGKHLP